MRLTHGSRERSSVTNDANGSALRRMPGMEKEGFSTKAVHAGEAREKAGNAVTTPIFQTATYTFRDSHELIEYMEGHVEREEYGRYGNPTQRVVERKLAALDGGEAALLFSTGMCAITTTLLA